MKNKEYVNMQHVIGQLAIDYNVPVLHFEDLVTLGQYAVKVYGLENHAKKIPFADLCEYITAYIKTPFGANVLHKLAENNHDNR